MGIPRSRYVTRSVYMTRWKVNSKWQMSALSTEWNNVVELWNHEKSFQYQYRRALEMCSPNPACRRSTRFNLCRHSNTIWIIWMKCSFAPNLLVIGELHLALMASLYPEEKCLVQDVYIRQVKIGSWRGWFFSPKPWTDWRSRKLAGLGYILEAIYPKPVDSFKFGVDFVHNSLSFAIGEL